VELPQTRNYVCAPEAEILDVSAQSDIEIYIICAPLKHIPTPLAFGWLCPELHSVELPQTRNYVYAPEAEIPDVSAQSDIEIYIIGTPMNHIPGSMTIGCLWRKLD